MLKSSMIYREDLDMKKYTPRLVKNTSAPKESPETIEECCRLLTANITKKAAEILQKLAQEGNPKACFMLSELYERGTGVKKDYQKFLDWLSRAVELQDPDAEVKFATMIAPFHTPGKFDYRACARELSKAVSHKNPRAMLELGKLYFSGHGVTKDHQEGRKLIEEAAALDPGINACEMIGTCLYSEGLTREAYPLLKDAFNQGCYEVSGMLSAYYMRGLCGVTENLEKAYGILKQGANCNNGLSEYILGIYYRENADVKRMIHYFSQSHLHKFPEAAYELANAILKTRPAGSSDRQQAFRLIREAATYPCLNHVDALADLGTLYCEGIGTVKNPAQGMETFEEVLKLNSEHTVALFGLACCLLYGRGCKQDVSRGLELLKKASDLGDCHATSELCSLYNLGTFLPQEEEQFNAYLKKSASQGDDSACFRLYEIHKNNNDQEQAQKYLNQAFNLGCQKAVSEKCRLIREGLEVSDVEYNTAAMANDCFCRLNTDYIKLPLRDNDSLDDAYENVRAMLAARLRLGLPSDPADFLSFDEDDLADIPLVNKV